MKKLSLSLTAALVSAALLAGCTNTNVKTQSTDGYRNNNIYTKNQGYYKRLDVGTTNPAAGTATTKFSDVPSTEWFAANVQWASDIGLVDGYPDGTFQPNKSMTRAEVIKLIKSLSDKGYITAPAGGTTTTPGGTTTTTPGGTTTTPGGTTTTTPGGTTTTTPGGTTTTTP